MATSRGGDEAGRAGVEVRLELLSGHIDIDGGDVVHHPAGEDLLAVGLREVAPQEAHAAAG